MLRINKNTPVIKPGKEDNPSDNISKFTWSSDLTFESPDNDDMIYKDNDDKDDMILSDIDRYFIGWDGI